MTANLCDINVWLALSLSGHLHHEAARDWLETIDEPASIQFAGLLSRACFGCSPTPRCWRPTAIRR